eukprot:TRINITY_DN782053_c0_g1_i1.p1 TRINITY_DN782053_c0_g1~~TRINITY_DN782053_c0_g1_i1.p1  ORF type:complete len:609 (-),score=129.05 TRINITY_DN782053_c0_g1_i1:333-2159(-)
MFLKTFCALVFLFCVANSKPLELNYELADKGDFVSKIQIGHPLQTLQVRIDFGKVDSFIESSLCNECSTAHPDLTFFDTEKSTTYRRGQYKHTITCSRYDQSLSGYNGIDNVVVGGSTIESFSFTAIDKSNDCQEYMKSYAKYAGLLATGPTTNIGDYETNLFHVLSARKLISKPMMTVKANDNSNYRKGGKILFGDVDTSNINSWQKTAADNIWAAHADGTSQIGNTSINSLKFINFFFNQDAIVTSKKVATSILEEIGAIPYPADPRIHLVDCDKRSSLPDIVLSIRDDVKLTLTPSEYVVLTPKGHCAVLVFGEDSIHDNILNVGASIFNKNDIVFNSKDSTIGFHSSLAQESGILGFIGTLTGVSVYGWFGVIIYKLHTKDIESKKTDGRGGISTILHSFVMLCLCWTVKKDMFWLQVTSWIGMVIGFLLLSGYLSVAEQKQRVVVYIWGFLAAFVGSIVWLDHKYSGYDDNTYNDNGFDYKSRVQGFAALVTATFILRGSISCGPMSSWFQYRKHTSPIVFSVISLVNNIVWCAYGMIIGYWGIWVGRLMLVFNILELIIVFLAYQKGKSAAAQQHSRPLLGNSSSTGRVQRKKPVANGPQNV